MVQHRLDHLRRNAKPGHTRGASSAQIMKAPAICNQVCSPHYQGAMGNNSVLSGKLQKYDPGAEGLCFITIVSHVDQGEPQVAMQPYNFIS
jgi:hypothetical protein